MQGVLVQARLGRSVMNRLFAAYTAAAFAAALLMSAFVAGGAGASAAVGIAGAFAVVVAVAGWRGYEPARTVLPDLTGHRHPRDGTRRVVLICGALIFTAFLADSAVSTWSTIYLHDTLLASDAVAPLGYAAYQSAVLFSRLVGDHLVPRTGVVPAAAAALLVCAAGCGLVVAIPSTAAAIVGFALTGIGVGVLVPLAFSAVGHAAPGNSDEVIARVNLFNYGGALIGAVLLGTAVGAGRAARRLPRPGGVPAAHPARGAAPAAAHRRGAGPAGVVMCRPGCEIRQARSVRRRQRRHRRSPWSGAGPWRHHLRRG